MKNKKKKHIPFENIDTLPESKPFKGFDAMEKLIYRLPIPKKLQGTTAIFPVLLNHQRYDITIPSVSPITEIRIEYKVEKPKKFKGFTEPVGYLVSKDRDSDELEREGLAWCKKNHICG